CPLFTLTLLLLCSQLLWGNFDKEFTKMAVELTPTDKLFIMNLDQNEFQGFSFTNPEYIIQV
uniref:Protein kinase C-terminal domain-containing protein n=1 Tax=Hucho hucho TaxID=62062 RepID=A0A4W5RRH3_9TELE